MTTVIILLAGMGRRMNMGKNKLLLEFVLLHTRKI